MQLIDLLPKDSLARLLSQSCIEKLHVWIEMDREENGIAKDNPLLQWIILCNRSGSKWIGLCFFESGQPERALTLKEWLERAYTSSEIPGEKACRT